MTRRTEYQGFARARLEFGSEQGSIISTLGVAMSIIVNISILTIGVMLGSAILKNLPPVVTRALRYILPAVFGSLFGNFCGEQPKIGIFAAIIGIFMTFLIKKGYLSFLPGFPVYAVIIVSVFGTILIARKMHEKGMIK